MLVLAESRASEPLAQAPLLQLTPMLSVACELDDKLAELLEEGLFPPSGKDHSFLLK
jgi:hypothetical protein